MAADPFALAPGPTRRAAAHAVATGRPPTPPRSTPRVRGERVHALTEVVMDYCARSKGGAGPDDPEPRLLAGMVVGVEMAVIELWGRSGLGLSEIFEAAEAAVPDLVRTKEGRAPLSAGENGACHGPLPGLDCQKVTILPLGRDPSRGAPACCTDDVQVISVDDHVIEHERVWLDRLPAKYREAGPRMVELDGGKQAWSFEGRIIPTIGLNAVAGKDPKDFGVDPVRFDDMLPGLLRRHRPAGRHGPRRSARPDVLPVLSRLRRRDVLLRRRTRSSPQHASWPGTTSSSTSGPPPHRTGSSPW